MIIIIVNNFTRSFMYTISLIPQFKEPEVRQTSQGLCNNPTPHIVFEIDCTTDLPCKPSPSFPARLTS